MNNAIEGLLIGTGFTYLYSGGYYQVIFTLTAGRFDIVYCQAPQFIGKIVCREYRIIDIKDAERLSREYLDRYLQSVNQGLGSPGKNDHVSGGPVGSNDAGLVP